MLNIPTRSILWSPEKGRNVEGGGDTLAHFFAAVIPHEEESGPVHGS